MKPPRPFGRFAASLAVLLFFCAVMALRQFQYPHYLTLLEWTDGLPNKLPFGDLNAILEAGACWRHGVDVYVRNACMVGGMYNYAPFLLRAGLLPIGPQDRMAGGVLLDLGCIGALSLLPPPVCYAELAMRAAAALSPTTIWALESANFDIVVFMMTILGVLLMTSNQRLRSAGYAVFLLAAACKFYPIFLLPLAARERLPYLAAIIVASAIAVLIYLHFYAHGSATAIAELPGDVPFYGVFGSMNMPFGLVLLHGMPVTTMTPTYGDYHLAMDSLYQMAKVIYVGTRLLLVAAAVAAILSARSYEKPLAALQGHREAFFAAGALVVTGCFFGAQNLGYRGIFLLLILPGLWTMARAGGGRRPYWLLAATLFLLWEALPRMLLQNLHASLYLAFLYWLLREVTWWWLISQLAAMLICYFRAQAKRLGDEGRLLFVNKKQQKNFIDLLSWRCSVRAMTRGSKVFSASFFQNRSACFLRHFRSNPHA